MKFSCNQQILSKALNTVSKAVTTRTTIPILKGIRLQVTDDGKLTMAASDLDISIERTVDVDVSSTGSIVVFAKLFTDIIRKLPNQQVTIELNESGNVNIRTLNSEFNIVGQPADEFPGMGEIEDVKDQLSLPQEIWKEMIRKTQFSASVDESKGIIVGVLMEMTGNSMNMVALDGFRMAVTREKMINKEERNIIISAKILNEIYKLLSDSEEEEDVQFILSDKKAVLLMKKTKVVMRLMEGEFIKYKDIIPKNNQTRIVVNRAELQDSIDRASLLAKEGRNNLIRCKIEENLLTITSASEEGEVKEEIIMDKIGEDIEIGFNSKYVSDALKVIDDEEIVMEFNTSITPCLVKPLEGDNYEYMILPVRIPSY